jgi:hypothetical protein
MMSEELLEIMRDYILTKTDKLGDPWAVTVDVLYNMCPRAQQCFLKGLERVENGSSELLILYRQTVEVDENEN